MADIGVCGPDEPYRQDLGGRWALKVAAGPGVILSYGDRYTKHMTGITSSEPNRRMIWPSHRVLLGTTWSQGVSRR